MVVVGLCRHGHGLALKRRLRRLRVDLLLLRDTAHGGYAWRGGRLRQAAFGPEGDIRLCDPNIRRSRCWQRGVRRPAVALAAHPVADFGGAHAHLAVVVVAAVLGAYALVRLALEADVEMTTDAQGNGRVHTLWQSDARAWQRVLLAGTLVQNFIRLVVCEVMRG